MIAEPADPCDWCGEPIGRTAWTRGHPYNVLCRSPRCRREYARREGARLAWHLSTTPEERAACARAGFAAAGAAGVAQAQVANAMSQRCTDPVERRLRIMRAVIEGVQLVANAIVGDVR